MLSKRRQKFIFYHSEEESPYTRHVLEFFQPLQYTLWKTTSASSFNCPPIIGEPCSLNKLSWIELWSTAKQHKQIHQQIEQNAQVMDEKLDIEKLMLAKIYL